MDFVPFVELNAAALNLRSLVNEVCHFFIPLTFKLLFLVEFLEYRLVL